MWKLLVSKLASHLPKPTQISVCLEETGEFCHFVACSFGHIGRVVIRVKVNQVLAREMEVQADDIRGLAVHIEMENLPCSFGGSQEMAVDVFVNLIVTLHLK